MLKSVRIIFNTEEIFIQKILIMPKRPSTKQNI